LDELLAGVTSREPLKPADSRSSAVFERVVIDGEPYVLKVIDGSKDWLAIASADVAGRAVCLFEDGVYDRIPAAIDHAVTGAARLGPTGSPFPCALLMRDVTDALMPEGETADLPTHTAFLEAMATLHAHFWVAPPKTTYMPLVQNYRMVSPQQARLQAATGTSGPILPFVEPGWAMVAEHAPRLYAAVAPLLDDPQPLADALLATPSTLLQGDWKMGNLGRHPDGRVVLLDWDRPSAGPCTVDLAYYLAVNCDRLPEGKDDTVQRYRSALEVRGVDTGSWWDHQLRLALLGAAVSLGWSKGAQPEELDWWENAVVPLLPQAGPPR
jgi:hypothetical protein